MRIAKYLWASPTTVLGLGITGIALLTGGRSAIVDGVVETHGGIANFILKRLVPLPGGASAMTLGHVVIGRDEGLLTETRAHERIHVRQYERWGPFFVPAYFVASLWLKLRGRDAYRENPFEREAFEAVP